MQMVRKYKTLREKATAQDNVTEWDNIFKKNALKL